MVPDCCKNKSVGFLRTTKIIATNLFLAFAFLNGLVWLHVGLVWPACTFYTTVLFNTYQEKKARASMCRPGKTSIYYNMAVYVCQLMKAGGRVGRMLGCQ